MTLLVRLFAVLLAGVLIAFASYKILWPKPNFAGDYRTENKRGSYVLRLVDAETAVMIYTDPKSNRYAYRGSMAPRDNSLDVTWSHRRVGEEWEPLPSPLKATIRFESADQLVTAEGKFQRVPQPFWRRWFSL
ncbi:MAG TPA: hypothetical protein VEC35_09290 [Noviherbaspirillum sp.]|nr:hypothetical protein [Noviherbaspirillum sp.]